MTMRIPALAGALALGVSALALAAVEEHNASVDLALHSIHAVTPEGSMDPAHDGQCEERYHAMLGEAVHTTYSINPDTSIMSAEVTFEEEHAELHPLGIEGTYSFMSDGVPHGWEEHGIFQAMFEIDTHYEHAQSNFLAHLNDEANCVLSSQDDDHH
ncbi:hypothetical protein [Woodsholea maritima]|uniref:hypothetical protein n=1 Tax=Woodsholea maritima TaxID=240237 RepID=UPI0012E9D789|nr:hypothetical protein [Woodsholea maritima]